MSKVKILILGWFAATPCGLSQPYDTEPWLRLVGPISHLKVAPGERHMLYTGEEGRGLFILDLKQERVIRVTEHQVGFGSFFSPDGLRVFYRQLLKGAEHDVISQVKAYHLSYHRYHDLISRAGVISPLSFDPRDMRFQLYDGQKLITHQIVLPDQRFAPWQLMAQTHRGRFLVTQKAVVSVSQDGFQLHRLHDDGSGVQSFDIAPDGSAVVWATQQGRVFFCVGFPCEPKLLAHGFDPVWHPKHEQILFTQVRKVGPKILDSDIALVNLQGKRRKLTRTPGRKERWPRWLRSGQAIVFTLEQTTDLFLLEQKVAL